MENLFDVGNCYEVVLPENCDHPLLPVCMVWPVLETMCRLQLSGLTPLHELLLNVSSHCGPGSSVGWSSGSRRRR